MLKALMRARSRRPIRCSNGTMTAPPPKPDKAENIPASMPNPAKEKEPGKSLAPSGPVAPDQTCPVLNSFHRPVAFRQRTSPNIRLNTALNTSGRYPWVACRVHATQTATTPAGMPTRSQSNG